jgi:hypothetical protein
MNVETLERQQEFGTNICEYISEPSHHSISFPSWLLFPCISDQILSLVVPINEKSLMAVAPCSSFLTRDRNEAPPLCSVAEGSQGLHQQLNERKMEVGWAVYQGRTHAFWGELETLWKWRFGPKIYMVMENASSFGGPPGVEFLDKNSSFLVETISMLPLELLLHLYFGVLQYFIHTDV